MTKTIFIDAENGGLNIFHGPGNKIGWAKTAGMLADICVMNDVHGPVHFCSSMDFATDYGFDTNEAAYDLFEDFEKCMNDPVYFAQQVSKRS